MKKAIFAVVLMVTLCVGGFISVYRDTRSPVSNAAEPIEKTSEIIICERPQVNETVEEVVEEAVEEVVEESIEEVVTTNTTTKNDVEIVESQETHSVPVNVVIENVETKTSLGTFKLTAYCSCEKCCGYWATVRPLDENGNPIVYTASGAVAQSNYTIAVDPSVISYGSEVEINGHTYVAQDTGGAIKGNRIDVYFDNHNDALEFGVKNAEVFLLSGG